MNWEKGKSELLYSRAEIEVLVLDIAKAIYKSDYRPDIVIPIMIGGFMFCADLMRELYAFNINPRMDVLWLSSYQDKKSRGAISLVSLPRERFKNQSVLLVDGVLDSGQTIRRARSVIFGLGAGKVRTAVLIDKQLPQALETADFAGVTGDVGFVFGYGMDDGGFSRGASGVFRSKSD